MQIIKENIVGLLRFIRLLFTTFILPSRSTERRIQDYSSNKLELMERHRELMEKHQNLMKESDKYEALIGSSETLVPTETVFCPKCHILVAQLRRTKQGVEIIQHGKVLVTVGSNITIKKDGQEMRGFPMKCPNGHAVRIE